MRANEFGGRSAGPSGKDMIHFRKHSSRKNTKDAARNAGDGEPIKHSSPKRGDPHYHSTKGGGKSNDGVHHTYPKR